MVQIWRDTEKNWFCGARLYWNYDKEAKQYFDITPNIDDEMTHKYVVDTELMNYEVSDDELSVIH